MKARTYCSKCGKLKLIQSGKYDIKGNFQCRECQLVYREEAKDRIRVMAPWFYKK